MGGLMRSDLKPDAFVINWLVDHVIRDRSRKEVVSMLSLIFAVLATANNIVWGDGSVVSILD